MVVALLAIVLCFLIWGLRPAKQASTVSSGPEPLTMAMQRSTPQITKRAHIASAANVPIVFYGKFVDQFDQPVSGVRVEADVPNWNVIGLIQHVSRTQTKVFYSDLHGQLVVSGMSGESLSLHIAKEGYELAPGSLGGYGYGPGVSIHHEPNPAKPVVYRMWKRQGAAELVGVSFRSMIPSDGQSIWIAENSVKCSRTELPDACLKLTVIRERRILTFDDKSPYKWSFKIEMLGGGIIKTDDLFLYQAPETGYVPTLSVLHEAADAGWVREQKITFYFKTNKNKYGRGEVFISNWENESDVYFRMNLTFNSDGSRNLEPKPE